MTSAASTTNPTQDHKNELVFASDANEWGQITGLEPRATYFVMRKPTADLTKEKSKEMLEEVKAFLHEHRVLTEKQMTELNTRYGEPAKARVNEIRSTLERRFDEISKEIENRIEKLETDLNDRGILRTKLQSAGVTSETPGEIPTGAAPTETKVAPKKRTPKNE
ncbi:MAG: hypothetical protein WDA16_08460 [Candidatus Thermoplasmatota archaeon]